MTFSLHRVVMWAALAAACAACGKSSSPPPSKQTDALPGQLLDLAAMEADAAAAPVLEVPFQLPTAYHVVALPAAPAAYIFVGPDGGMRVGARPTYTDATAATDLEAVRKLLPPGPATTGLLGDTSDGGLGTIGTGRYGTIGGGSANPLGDGYGGGVGAIGSGYGVGGGGTYEAFRFTAVRSAPAEARVVIVADRDTSITHLASIVAGQREPYAVAVRSGTGAIGALALPLFGIGGGVTPYTLGVSSTGATVDGFDNGGSRTVPAGPDGVLEPARLRDEMKGLYADAVGGAVAIGLVVHTRGTVWELVAGLDSLAPGTTPVPVSVRGGASGMRGRSSVLPQVRIGQPSTVGDLDKAIIRRYIKRNIQKIMYCYEKQLVVKPGIEGTVTAEFVIGPDGKVPSSKGTGLDSTVAQCIAGVIHAIEFPRPKSGGIVQVSYPFSFRPTGG